MKVPNLLLLILIALSISARAQTLSAHHPEYVLQQGDVLEIHYRYTPEFDQLVTVRPDDRVTLVNLGTIATYDKTVSDFKKEVVELSKTRLVDPDITVILKEFDKPHVYVEGEVNTPGRVDIRSDMSVLDAIALAGGFKATSSKSKVLLLRRTGPADDKRTAVLDLKKLIDNKQMEETVPVLSGDVIYVTQNTLSKVERIMHMVQIGAIYNPIH